MASSIQVHKIHVAVHGIQLDPLVISANDCVSWVWLDDESFSIQEILEPDGDVGDTVVHNSEDAYKRYDASNKGVYMYVSRILKDLSALNFFCKKILKLF